MEISRDSRLSLMNDNHFLAFGDIYENIRIFKGSMFFLHFNFHYICINQYVSITTISSLFYRINNAASSSRLRCLRFLSASRTSAKIPERGFRGGMQPRIFRCILLLRVSPLILLSSSLFSPFPLSFPSMLLHSKCVLFLYLFGTRDLVPFYSRIPLRVVVGPTGT